MDVTYDSVTMTYRFVLSKTKRENKLLLVPSPNTTGIPAPPTSEFGDLLYLPKSASLDFPLPQSGRERVSVSLIVDTYDGDGSCLEPEAIVSRYRLVKPSRGKGFRKRVNDWDAAGSWCLEVKINPLLYKSIDRSNGPLSFVGEETVGVRKVEHRLEFLVK
ncbi:MAG: hypothetical protein AABW73_02410 [Nanoarchaeota archaeon]